MDRHRDDESAAGVGGEKRGERKVEGGEDEREGEGGRGAGRRRDRGHC